MSRALAGACTAALVAIAVGFLVPPDPRGRLHGSRRPMVAARARRRARRRPARAVPGVVPAPVVVDLVAAALLTGLPPEVAVRGVADVLDDAGDPGGRALRSLVPPTGDRTAGPLPAAFAELGQALGLAARTGLGPVGLVQAAAAESRRIATAHRQVAARRLGTLVVLPTGLCLLPAFVLLTVAPLVLDLVLG